MDTSTTNTTDEAPVCGFCKEGSSVDDVCGKLHVEKLPGNKIIAAHHKCMQYSALLVQYKFDHFGGFKIDKVQRELTRGKKVICSICRKNKSRKGKTTGATSGCAIRSCRKSFHYYCAKLDPVAVTKRMLVRYKNQNREVVLYRVFCGEAHREQFKENKEDFIAPQDKNNDSDETGGSDQDDGNNTGNSSTDDIENDAEKTEEETNPNQDLKQEINKDDISMCTVGSPDNRSFLLEKQNGNQGFTPFRDVSYIDHHKGEGDSLLVGSAEKSDKVVSSTPVVPPVEKLNGDNSESTSSEVKKVLKAAKSDSKLANNNKKKSQPAKSMTISKSLFNGKLSEKAGKTKSLSLSKNKQKLSSKESPSLPKRVLDVKDQHNDTASSSETDTDSITVTNKNYPNFGLIIVDKLDKSKHDALKQEIATSFKNCEIEAANCILWSTLFDSSGIPDFERKVPHLISDLISMLKEKDFVKVAKLLLDNEKMINHLHNYNYVLNLESKLDQQYLKTMAKSLFDLIENGLTEASKICGYDVGKLIYPKCSPDTKAFVLVVNDIFDNKGQMRSQFSDLCLDAYRLTTGIQLKHEGEVKLDIECDTLEKLITNSVSVYFRLCGVPESKFLLADNQAKKFQTKNEKSNKEESAILHLEKKLRGQETKRKIKIDNSVICIRNVDSSLVNYKGLCHKVLKHVTADHNMRKKNQFILLDVTGNDFKTLEDIVPAEIRNHNPDLTVYTAFPPDQKRVTCAVIEIKCQPIASGSGHSSHQNHHEKMASSGSGINGSIINESSSTSDDDSDDETDSLSSGVGRQSLRSSVECLRKSPRKSASSPCGSKQSSPVKSSPSVKSGRSSPRYFLASQVTSPARQSLKRPHEAESPTKQSKFAKKS